MVRFLYQTLEADFNRVNPLFSHQDVQYILNPGGDADAEDAVVGTARVEITF